MSTPKRNKGSRAGHSESKSVQDANEEVFHQVMGPEYGAAASVLLRPKMDPPKLGRTTDFEHWHFRFMKTVLRRRWSGGAERHGQRA